VVTSGASWRMKEARERKDRRDGDAPHAWEHVAWRQRNDRLEHRRRTTPRGAAEHYVA